MIGDFISAGDLVAFEDSGKTLRGIVVGRPISGMLKIDVPSKAKPFYRTADDVELLVKANYDIDADEPLRPIDVAIIVEGGLVQNVRASAPVNVSIIDLDVFEGCYGDVESLCHINEPQTDRNEHSEVREAYEAAQMLAVEAM